MQSMGWKRQNTKEMEISQEMAAANQKSTKNRKQGMTLRIEQRKD